MKKFAISMCLILAMLLSLTACGGEPEPTEPEYDFQFTGAVTMGGEGAVVEYNVVMTGKDGKFKFQPNALTPIRGTYVYTEGQGYTFSFQDANGTDVRTVWDAAKKEFSFIYKMDLGAARGVGNVKLTYQDPDFVQQGEPWSEIPSFAGAANFGFITANMQMVCKADGTFSLFSTDFGQYVSAQSGTYTFENGVYVFQVEGGPQYVSEVRDGIHVLTVLLSLPVLSQYDVPCEITQVILTVD